jgi:carboxymethylenebutenolidase
VKLFALLLSMFLFASTGAQAQDWAKERLNKSPRHQDWVTLKSGDRNLKAFIVYPETSHKAAAVLLIHENMGLTDWAKEMADEIAAQGYIVIAPDLLNEKVYTEQADAKKAVAELKPDQITQDLNAAAEYVTHVPSANGKLVVAGFCWGGGQSFRYATNNPNLKAAFVFYGQPPQTADMARITAPIYGFYGGNDNRITSTVEATAGSMKEAGKAYHPETYADAGHGFMRAGEAPDANQANKKAREQGFARLVKTLKTTTK